MAQRPTGYEPCPACGRDTPPGRYCVYCGTELAGGRRGFGANPQERAHVPHLISTLFPALPRADMRAFRIVLAGGAVLVVGLAAGGVFPLALVAAALLVPILTAIYLWDVDVYEDQPWRVILMTIGIGAAAGVLLGVASELLVDDTEPDLVLVGVVLPLAALVLALAGPIVLLLPRARFNDILDGATFAAVSAAAVTACVALARGVSLLGGGLRPEGDTGEWVLRLAGLGIGVPVLAMCAAGGVGAALWARWRAPLGDRSALGPLAHPAVAVPLAAALVVAGAVTQVELPGGAWLAVLAALDVIGLLWLRRVIGEGLRQQAGEHPPGAPTPCRQCGVATPLHAYCGNCGVARSALPKGEHERAFGRLIGIPAAVLAVGLGLATAGAAIAAPGSLAPPCVRGEACGAPPAPPSPLVRETEIRGAGWVGAYDPELFTVAASDANGFDLDASGAPVTVRVRVAAGRDVDAALTAERDRLSGQILGLVDDSDPEHRVAGAMVGYRPAKTLVLAGTADTPQGPGDGATAVVLGATDGRLVATVTVTALGGNDDRRRAVMGLADVVLQGFQWSTTAPTSFSLNPGSRKMTFARVAPAPRARGVVSAALVLRPRHTAALDARVARGAPPLSAREIGRRFGPTERQLAALRRAVRARGLTPGPVPPQRTTMPISGPAPRVERTFGIHLLADQTGRYPDHVAELPNTMRVAAIAVSGLDTRPAYRSAAFPAGGMRPFDARRVYGLDQLPARGEGQTVAVLSLDTFNPKDIALYDSIVGIDSGPVQRVSVGAPITTPGPEAEEVNLDLDVIRGLVPKATLISYESQNHPGAFGEVVDRVVADGKAKVLSVSWGRCERTLPAAERARDEAAFRAAAAAGVTIVVASGDSGAYECERFDTADQRLSVSWPAASRYVLAVGGTTLRLGDDRRRESEVGWESPLSNAGGGGGVAVAEPQPAWQHAASGMRQVPDVAAAADFRSGWLAVVDGQPHAFGGTSAAAPFWAAALTVIRQTLRQGGDQAPSDIPRTLYELAARPNSRAFYDVTVGENRFYSAGPGWDHATGLGTPNVRAIVDALQRTR